MWALNELLSAIFHSTVQLQRLTTSSAYHTLASSPIIRTRSPWRALHSLIAILQFFFSLYSLPILLQQVELYHRSKVCISGCAGLWNIKHEINKPFVVVTVDDLHHVFREVRKRSLLTFHFYFFRVWFLNELKKTASESQIFHAASDGAEEEKISSRARNLKLFELQQDDDEIPNDDERRAEALIWDNELSELARIYFFLFDFVFICLFFFRSSFFSPSRTLPAPAPLSTVCKHIFTLRKKPRREREAKKKDFAGKRNNIARRFIT